jgi:hypothetical protein
MANNKPIHNSTFIPIKLTVEQEIRYFRNRSISDSRPDTDDNTDNIKQRELNGDTINKLWELAKQLNIMCPHKTESDYFNILLRAIKG